MWICGAEASLPSLVPDEAVRTSTVERSRASGRRPGLVEHWMARVDRTHLHDGVWIDVDSLSQPAELKTYATKVRKYGSTIVQLLCSC
jgi:hypothetical protein